MYPSDKDKTYGTFVKCFKDGIQHYNPSTIFFSVVIKGRTNSFIIKFYKYIVFYIKILIFILFKKYDLVYVHQITHASPILLLIRSIKKFKLVMNIHGGDLLTRTKISAFLFHFSSRLIKKSDLIVLPSLYFKNILLQKLPFVPDSKTFVSPSGGINNNIFQYQNNHKRSNKIIFISRIDSGKGWDTLLYAMKNIKEKGELNISCYIAGGGLQVEKLKELIDELNLKEICIYIGALTHNEMNQYYHDVDCLIFPTQLKESLGLVGIEAMSCGCPVIGSDIGCLPEYIKNDGNGFLFTPGNTIELTDCIEKLYKLNDFQYTKLRQNAYETSLTYNSSYVAQKMYERLQQLISNK